MIVTKVFKDGIAFYKNNYEIAFYNIITRHINYYDYGISHAYPGWVSFDTVSFPIEDNLEIMRICEEYRRSLNV